MAAMRQPVSIEDYVAIQRLVNRYVDAVIHRNGVQWTSCWDEHAVWDLGGGHLVEGRDAISGLWYRAMAGMTAVVQHVHNGDAWYDGDDRSGAEGRWAVSERFSTSNGDRGLLLAHYDDCYRKTEDGWLFSRRLLQVHYRGAPDLSGEFTNTRAGLEARGLVVDI
jgi:hypothetical protein